MTSIHQLALLALVFGCQSKPDARLLEGAEPAGVTYAPPAMDEDPDPDPPDDTGTEVVDTGDPEDCVPEDEVCDGIDNDCDGYVDEGLVPTWFEDVDGDGHGDAASTVDACNVPDGFVDNADDCNDDNENIGPHAEEECNGADDDCDGRIDEGVGAVYYEDTDGDGYGDPDTEMIDCSPPIGHTTWTGDCNDDDPDVHPGADEVCDGVDDDCDGVIDDNPTAGASMFFGDADGDGYGSEDRPVAACDLPEGYVTHATDCDDTDDSIHPEATESCNDIDDDCDGTVDEDVLLTWYIDGDGDGHGDGDGMTSLSCTAPDGFAGSRDDCDDSRTDVYTDAVEVCDDVDNDCDGVIDDGVLLTFYVDGDGDGWGGEHTMACSLPEGAVSVDGDCDDSRVDVNPDAAEWCDEADNDCDGAVDEGVTSVLYEDFDLDGYGDPDVASDGCRESDGWVFDDTDCDDVDADTHPEAAEWCDETDNDCDDEIDEEAVDMEPYYLDTDGDGYADILEYVFACSTPESDDGDYFAEGPFDCDDDDAFISPVAAEVCDWIDNDCDGRIDVDSTDVSTWYRDADGDEYGDASTSREFCWGEDGWVGDDADCNDDDEDIHPGAVDDCDSIDSDCNGLIDDDDVCPCTMHHWEGHAYQFCNSKKTWQQGSNQCDDEHYELVTINDHAEEVWLNSIIDTISTQTWWIGFNDKTDEDNWVWVDGTPGSWTDDGDDDDDLYAAWHWGEPNDSGTEDCAEINYGGTVGYDWNDKNCGSKRRYICEAGD